ncbi:MAG: nucleotide exchange factor GrpE [Anaerolineales bacterium]|nr:nucleotide exchange factor GrpE [Anaerolineales bacterium]
MPNRKAENHTEKQNEPIEPDIEQTQAGETETAAVDEQQLLTPEGEIKGDSVEIRIKELEEKLLSAQQQSDENLNGWQRSLAEFSNYKKRTERESDETRTRLKGEILLPLLDAYDDLKLAISDRPLEGETAQWAAGIEMIFLKFQNALNNMGVEAIEENGVPFDPNLHEAITYEKSEDVDEGHVIDVFQSGYRIGERILRPARVRVAS